MQYESINFDECLKRFAQECNITETNEQKSMVYTIDNVKRWHEILLSENGKKIREFLLTKRGINEKSLKKYLIGYYQNKEAITIPLYDIEKLICVKFFNYNLSSGEKKVTTAGSATLLGVNFLNLIEPLDQTIYITEGELDCILLSQFGLVAVSGSAGALTWKKSWNKYFRNANVVLCYDSDETGKKGAEKTAIELFGTATSIKIITLFPDGASKDKKDITDFFVKCGRSIDEFIDIVKNSQCLTEKDIDILKGRISCEPEEKQRRKSSRKVSRDEFMVLLKNEKESVKLNPAQDFNAGKMHYAVMVDNNKYILSSDKNVVPFNAASEGGMLLVTTELDMFGFTAEGITKFLNDGYTETEYDVFSLIKSYIKRFIFLKQEETYSLLALWVIGTYLYRVFRYFPYIHLNAEKGSGKTMLMEVLAPLCFNGQISINSTEAVLFRDIQNNSPTMFLDELEKMSKEEKEKYSGILSVLKTGFTKNGFVKRCDGKNKDKIRTFTTYSPKMLAGIKEIDDVLADRTIRIKMYRKLNNEFFERYTETPEIAALQKDLRNSLYAFALKNADEIYKLYNKPSFETELESILTNREQDIWLPIITIAYFIDMKNHTELAKEMIEYSKYYLYDKKASDSSDNDTVKMLNVVNQFIQTYIPETIKDNVLYFKTETLFDYFKKQDEFSWLDSKSWLSRQLKKIEVKVEKYHTNEYNGRVFLINKPLLEEYMQRYC